MNENCVNNTQNWLNFIFNKKIFFYIQIKETSLLSVIKKRIFFSILHILKFKKRKLRNLCYFITNVHIKEMWLINHRMNRLRSNWNLLELAVGRALAYLANCLQTNFQTNKIKRKTLKLDSFESDLILPHLPKHSRFSFFWMVLIDLFMSFTSLSKALSL